MPLLLPFKRAGARERVLQLALYPAVAALAALVILPFALMLALSFGDPSDWWRQRKWPDLGYLLGGKRLYIYYLALRYDYWATWTGFNDAYRAAVPDSRTILDLDELPPLAGDWRLRAEDGLACLKDRVPWTHATVLFTGWGYFSQGSPVTAYTGLGDEAWKTHLRSRHGTIEAVNAAFHAEFLSFAHVQVPELPSPNRRDACPWGNPWMMEYRDFLENSVRPSWRLARPFSPNYRAYLEAREEVRTHTDLSPAATAEQRSAVRLQRVNELLGASCATWDEFRLPAAAPADPRQRKYWESYVREAVNPCFLRIETDPVLAAAWRKFLLDRHGSEEEVLAAHGTDGRAAQLPATAHETAPSATAYHDWDDFVRTVPLDSIRILSNESIWHDFLRRKYPTVEALNAAHGTSCSAFEDAAWPQPEIDRLDWEAGRREYLVEMLFKNYRRAWNLIAVSSPALFNTLKFAVLFTALSVIVNGTAGYALSRFTLGPGQMILVGFLALGAFPIEAMAVPNFLLLRKFGLLNTIWALVLPALVNGYFIYLMKSAFDAVPRNYFEQAQMEGAGDWTVFWRVALPAGRPMLAVVGLYAFLWSYSNFMWALIVCQQRSEWTLPVFIFNVNSWYAPAPLLGALMVLVSIPPLAVFLFAHRTLQRSLSLPRA